MKHVFVASLVTGDFISLILKLLQKGENNGEIVNVT